MSQFPEGFAETLRRARADKELSQRDLSERTGVPQSHISKIEQGAVDLRVSSLRALANALDLDIALVPRKAMPAVKSISQPRISDMPALPKFIKRPPEFELAERRLNEMRSKFKTEMEKVESAFSARPAYRLDEDEDA